MKRTRVALCLTMVLLLVVTLFTPATHASAAKKANLSESEMWIAIGTARCDGNIYDKSFKNDLKVENAIKGAKYSFTSSNTKIVTVKQTGNNVVVNGVKAGTAKITCTQTLKGKKTTVGTCKVNVGNSSVSICNSGICLGKDVVYNDYDSICHIYNRNVNAKYTYTPNKKGLTMSEQTCKIDYGPVKDAHIYVQKYTATQAGIYKVTVKETYNKKTRVVGSFTVEVLAPVYEKSTWLYEGEEFDVSYLIQNPMCNDTTFKSYSIEPDGFDASDANSPLTYDQKKKAYVGNKPGEVNVKLFYNNGKTKDMVAIIKVTVKQLTCEDLDIDMDDEYEISDGKCRVYIDKTPEKAPEEIKITSSDEKTGYVAYDKENEDFYFYPVKEGNVTITFTCGNVKKDIAVKVVKGDDDDDWDDDDDEDWDW